MSVPTAIAIICGEAHLRRVLKSYADYYNRFRTHRSLNKDAPVSRSVQRSGVIRSRAILGGLSLSVAFTVFLVPAAYLLVYGRRGAEDLAS